MPSTSRMALWPLTLFFFLGEVAAHVFPVFAPLWWFLSPFQWIASLAFIMTGSPATVDGLLMVIAYSEHGGISTLVRAAESGILGTMLVVSFTSVTQYTYDWSKTSGRAFSAVFYPIWISLILYKPLFEHCNAFTAMAGGLEGLDGDIRRGAGFGIILLALVVPMFSFMMSKAYELRTTPLRRARHRD